MPSGPQGSELGLSVAQAFLILRLATCERDMEQISGCLPFLEIWPNLEQFDRFLCCIQRCKKGQFLPPCDFHHSNLRLDSGREAIPSQSVQHRVVRSLRPRPNAE